jgi:hypothetical protein
MKNESAPARPTLESRSRRYLDVIRQIDAMLPDPVRTLVDVTNQEVPPKPKRPGKDTEGPGKDDKARNEEDAAGSSDDAAPLSMPRGSISLWISEDLVHTPDDTHSVLTRSIVGTTIQRLLRIQRRFDWLGKDEEQLARTRRAHDALLRPLATAGTAEDCFTACSDMLYSAVFGGLNPLVASRVFRLLMEKGEDAAHTPMGCLSFFAMVWPLCRGYPSAGVRMEPSDPTTYITAKCLIPLLRLQGIYSVRATLLKGVERSLSRMGALAGVPGAGDGDPPRGRNAARDRWLFTSELDALRSTFTQLAEVTIAEKALAACADALGRISDELLPASEPADVFPGVIREVIQALMAVRDQGASAYAQVSGMNAAIKASIVDVLDGMIPGREQRVFEHLKGRLKLNLAPEYLQSRERSREYLDDLHRAAVRALDRCTAIGEEYKTASELTLTMPLDPSSVDRACREAVDAVRKLEAQNQRLADEMQTEVHFPADWCRNVMDREIAHVTAKNIAEFDPSELASAIAVATRYNLLTTTRQVSDAIQKAVTGQREDGSWHMGKPYFSSDHVLGAFAPSVDISLTLADIVEQHPSVRDADEALFKFVDWLERTRVTLRFGADKSATGWPSDRLRHTRRIHLLITALAVDALLEIRDLCEHRLWELCRARFTVLDEDRPLQRVDPVDLGLPHRRRVHGVLARMVNETQRGVPGAKYSLVLHGPPGTSKTALVKALSVEMWHSSRRWRGRRPRLVQITPADFTRLGEDRIDSEARAIFELLSHVRRVTILFDEIDDLLRKREDKTTLRFMDLVVPAMLNRLQDLRSACPRQEICFVFGTNYIERIEEALMRSGRIDARLAVVYPDRQSRLAQVGRHVDRLLGKAAEEGDLALRAAAEVMERMAERIADETRQWSWMVLDQACDEVADGLVRKAQQAEGAPLPGDADLWADVQEVLVRRTAIISHPNYQERLGRTPGSGDLISEFLAFVFSELPSREEEDRKEAVLRATLLRELPSLRETEQSMRQFNDTLKSVRVDPIAYLRIQQMEAAGAP